VDGLSAIQLSAARLSAVGLSPLQSQQQRTHPAMDAAAKALGMSTSDLRDAMQSGQSLASIASSKGIGEGALTAAMAQAIEEANPSISADQATKVATAIATRTPSVGGSTQAVGSGTTEGVSGATPAHGHHHHHGGGAAMNAASQLLGMSTSDLTSAQQSGQSLASIATSKGVSQTDLVSAIATAIEGSTSGLSADQAKQIATQMVTRTPGSQTSQPWAAGTQQTAASTWAAGTQQTAVNTFSITA
jgi:hypothetical protein